LYDSLHQQQSCCDLTDTKFSATAGQALIDGGLEILRIASYAWCRPYYILEPEHCFVVDDGHGKAVGYIIGGPDTHAFVKQWHEKYIPYLKQEGVHAPGPDEDASWTENLHAALRKYIHDPDQLIHPEWPELMRDYPGHLHIDILPGFQRCGMGRQLMDAFLEQMRRHGSKGIHLGMVRSNEGAEQYYKRMGYKRFPKIIDEGKSGEEGTTGDSTYMVISL
jgi:GNAT superfamily N-acetyltransferase